MNERKTYLGDNVYAEWDGYGALILTSSIDDWGLSETIILTSQVRGALLDLIKASEGTK